MWKTLKTHSIQILQIIITFFSESVVLKFPRRKTCNIWWSQWSYGWYSFVQVMIFSCNCASKVPTTFNVILKDLCLFAYVQRLTASCITCCRIDFYPWTSRRLTICYIQSMRQPITPVDCEIHGLMWIVHGAYVYAIWHWWWVVLVPVIPQWASADL